MSLQLLSRGEVLETLTKMHDPTTAPITRGAAVAQASREYGSDEPYTPEALTKWVVANAHQVSVWLSPPGIKSLTLSPYVEEDSVMILFTPRNLLYTVNYNYNLVHKNFFYVIIFVVILFIVSSQVNDDSLLREVGQEYYNCDDNPWVKDFVQYLGNERAMSKDMYTDFELQCSQWREKVRREELTAPPVQVVSNFWANGSCSGRRRCKMCSTCSNKCLVNAQDVSKDCKCDGGPGFDSYLHQQVCWKQTHHGSNVGSSHPPSMKTSMLTGKDDERSSENLIEAAIEESCLRFHQAHNAHVPVFPRATYHRKTPRNFTGLACRTNKTLSFLAMDSVQFHQFAEGLGVNVLARKDKTAVVIFNAVDESSYLLEAELSKGSLVDFIVNYTEGFLSRSLRSTARKPIALNRYPEINSQNCQQDEGSICVLELTTDTFFSTVLDKDKAAPPTLYTAWTATQSILFEPSVTISPTVLGAHENSSFYWHSWQPLSLMFYRTNGKLPFFSLDKASQQWRVFSTVVPWSEASRDKQFCLNSLYFHRHPLPSTVSHVAGTLSYLPSRLTFPRLHPTTHRDTRVTRTPSFYLSTLLIYLSLSLAIPRAIVVLYHTPYCGFCHGVAHIFLTVARYFRTVAKLQFARIDGEHNDLPWEYTMDHFPAILFFPARRKSESRVFPRHLPVTVPNLVNFVLANLGPSESKLQGLIGLCAAWERGHDDKSARDCLTRVRQECLTIIANSLAVCRTTRLRRQFYLDSSSVRDSVSRHYQQLLYKKMKLLFLKLQHIKEIHLLLGSLDRLREDSREFRIIQSIFQVYLCSFNNGSADIPTSPETESIPVIDTRQATLQEHENVKDEL
uniref:(California timema) hypothetical protein n=1 Tax=Timema californicum TaxID=61474 RepID=A0A7R9P5E2_TIMCA|nr:unnamed protein product [Timema californicum]